MIKALKIINSVIFVSILGLVVSYMALANDLAVKSLALQDMKKGHDSLLVDKGQLDLEIANLKALSKVSEKIHDDGQFVDANDIEYLKAEKQVVAVK